MTKPEIISETPMNIVELRHEMEKIKKRDGELNFRAERTEDYVNHLVHLTAAKGREMYEKLEKLNVPRLKDVHIHKIIDTMPANLETLKAVLQGYVVTVSAENLKKIAAVVEEYAEKKKKE
jgi:DNA-directed RNA polymerase subunit F